MTTIRKNPRVEFFFHTFKPAMMIICLYTFCGFLRMPSLSMMPKKFLHDHDNNWFHNRFVDRFTYLMVTDGDASVQDAFDILELEPESRRQRFHRIFRFS